ncbi:hypothetical protein [Litchfieldia alkalitelluris]|uniref:hypothetical protein n=1 Tax=Litchfieldia alkalitelluris TaxID=304268 RepID=UPI001F1EECE8|nr:hypothetical protein [Litchfieldia alkalitelluris]
MKTQTIETLQFDDVKREVASYAISEIGMEKIHQLTPSCHKRQIDAWLNEVLEAKKLLRISSSVPIHGLKGIQQLLNTLHKSIVLRPEQLMNPILKSSRNL